MLEALEILSHAFIFLLIAVSPVVLVSEYKANERACNAEE